MAFPIRILTGAPGIYKLPDSPLREITGVRMDVCAFVGVAPRGPVRVPVVNELWPDDRPCLEDGRPRQRTVAIAVESFNQYRRLFGGFEGPGLLPYAVAAFFEQGGRRAYIARIVHDYPSAAEQNDGVAFGEIATTERSAPASLKLNARNEGAWGNKLRARLDLSTRPLAFASQSTHLTVEANIDFPVGTLLRLTGLDGHRSLAIVNAVTRQPGRIDWSSGEVIENEPGYVQVGTLDPPFLLDIESVEVVEGKLSIDDGDGRFEQHEQLGLARAHPRWMGTVLCYESELVYPDKAWIEGKILPADADLPPPPPSELFSGGEDRYPDIEPDDFFDNLWTLGDDEPGDGVHALTQLSDLSLLVVPDLYSPAPLPKASDVISPVSLAGPEFELCVDPLRVDEQAQQQLDLDGLRLDPLMPADLNTIIFNQQKLQNLAEVLRSFVVLLDVPPGLHQQQILKWRGRFDSAFVAAYHPWLRVSRRDDTRDRLVTVPPSAVAAGIVAKQELAFGVPHGPANVLGAEVVTVDDVVSPARHDELHPEGINVYLRERDGIRLTAARTLSRDPTLRQLSVRRLLTMIRRALEQQMQWAVFEPNNAALRLDVRLMLQGYLRHLFRIGAFRGASEEQAFFVRCDETNNPSYITDAGRLIADIGVAPSEPLEFVVLSLSRAGDGTLTIREKHA